MTKREKIAGDLDLAADDLQGLAESFRENDHDLWYVLVELNEIKKRIDGVSAEINAISNEALGRVLLSNKRDEEAQ